MSASDTTTVNQVDRPVSKPASISLSGTAMIVAALTAVGLAIRAVLLDQSPFGDELATYWDVTTHSLWGVIQTVHSDAEITPPLYFVLAKLASYIDATPAMLRLPSLIAGTATIPMTYLLGARTVGRRAAVVGAALVTLSPFLIYYSTEARGYQVMVALLLASSLALLRGLDGGGLRWWVAYAAFSCAAMLSHYTVAFALAAQAIWALWAHPKMRREVLLANLGAALAFLPWLTGFIADLNSPTTDILSLLQPFTWETIRISVEHFWIGYAYAVKPLGALPGHLALALFGLGALLALGSLAFFWLRDRSPIRLSAGLVLILALALATPVGEALVSAVSTNLFGTRNLAAAWPGCALLAGAILTSPPRREIQLAATALVLAAFAIGAVKMLGVTAHRPDYGGPAAAIEAEAKPADSVLEAVFSPGPLANLDVELGDRYPIVRLGASQERSHPFSAYDPILNPEQIARATIAATGPGGRVFVVGGRRGTLGPTEVRVLQLLRPRFRISSVRSFSGLYPVELLVLKPTGPASESPSG